VQTKKKLLAFSCWLLEMLQVSGFKLQDRTRFFGCFLGSIAKNAKEAKDAKEIADV
jgi:hypothetical protein